MNPVPSVRVEGSHVPRHRRRGHDRQSRRRSAGGRWGRAGGRAGRPDPRPGREPGRGAGFRPGRPGRRGHPRPALVGRAHARGATPSSTWPRSGSPSARRIPGSPTRCWPRARSTWSRLPATAGVRKVVASSSASIYGLAEEFPTTEKHHPWANDTIYGAAKVYNEGAAAQLPRDVGPGLRRPAVLQRVRAADGRPRGLHRGADPVDGADRHGASRRWCWATARRRWTSSTSGHRPGQRPGACRRRSPTGSTTWRSSVETSLLELADALAEVDGAFGAGGRVRAGAQGQPGQPAVGGHLGRGARLGWTAEIPLEVGLRDLVEWWRGQA